MIRYQLNNPTETMTQSEVQDMANIFADAQIAQMASDGIARDTASSRAFCATLFENAVAFLNMDYRIVRKSHLNGTKTIVFDERDGNF